MDGPVRLGSRTLAIDFEVDRHSQQRLEVAYRLIEPTEPSVETIDSTVQTAPQTLRNEPALTPEIHG
tara:strand:+ start:143 stop:343 length:201 start_codon:yes stop_codon:yes gene_type:complete